MSGYKAWTPGDIIAANDVQNYLQDQTVMVFASSAVRSTAIPVATEGMLTWVEDDNRYEYYNGSSWVSLISGVTGGVDGQPFVSNGGGTNTASFRDVSAEYINTTVATKSAAYTAVAADTNTTLNFTNSSNVTFTVPDVMPSVGDRIDVIRNGSGTVTISAGTGITSWAGAGTAGTATGFQMDVRYTAASIVKTAANEYRVIGRVIF